MCVPVVYSDGVLSLVSELQYDFMFCFAPVPVLRDKTIVSTETLLDFEVLATVL
jgi:hypothetical protein